MNVLNIFHFFVCLHISPLLVCAQADMAKVDGVTKDMVTDKVMATVAVMMVTAAAVATTTMAVMVDMVDIQTIRDTQIMVNTLTHQTKAITTHKRVITTNKISNINYAPIQMLCACYRRKRERVS